ncbi:MAG: hypothetical protein EXS43_06755 [Opitutus sp.]|nr:hypothetical protein [Opitutus sp.]
MSKAAKGSLASEISTYTDFVIHRKSAGGFSGRQLPVAPEFGVFTLAVMDPLSAAIPISLTGRKILVADDDRMNLRILGGILRAEAGRPRRGSRSLFV